VKKSIAFVPTASSVGDAILGRPKFGRAHVFEAK
jgi:hypothetical protein